MALEFHGLLVLDKPGGVTSRAAVDGALRWFPRGTRIGHTGTLDPLATGVLVLCLGFATRLAEYVQRMDKTYRARFRLGARSDTDDAEGKVSAVEGIVPEREQIERCLGTFLGAIDQVPPVFSAAKVSGQRAYALARKGKEVELQPRRVHIHGIELLRYAYPDLDVEIRCGKGTYIRSLARDLGERLGCGAFMAGLRRTRVGPFTENEALPLTVDAAGARGRLLPVESAVIQLPRVAVTADDVVRLRRGQSATIRPDDVAVREAVEAVAIDAAGNLVAVVLLHPHTGTAQPLKVLPTGSP